MAAKKSKIIIALIVLILLIGSASALAMYIQDCKQEMREVDRYALPYIIEVMEALDGWQYEKVEPYLTDRYKNIFTQDEWQKELGKLSVLGGLQSFHRPQFVSHVSFKKYVVCESAMDLYSVSTEYEKANAIVRLYFENNCGKLKVNNIKVTSSFLNQQQEQSEDPGLNEDQLGEIDMQEFEQNSSLEQDLKIDQLNVETNKPSQNEPTAKKKPKGTIYRY